MVARLAPDVPTPALITSILDRSEAAAGETVRWARRWKDRRDKLSLAVVSTDQSVHLLTEAGAPVLSVRRAFAPASLPRPESFSR